MNLPTFFPARSRTRSPDERTEVQRVGGTLSFMAMGAVWFTLVVAGFLTLMREAYTPVADSYLETAFPYDAGLTLDSSRPSLFVFAQPKCPCTKATFRELDQLRSQAANGLAVTIIFTVPVTVPAGWEKGDLLTAASRMTGINVVMDRGGFAARNFHVLGSGHVLVYAPDGRLLFSGGITPSRGHDGDTPGGAAIVRMAHGSWDAPLIQQPVYGCTLL